MFQEKKKVTLLEILFSRAWWWGWGCHNGLRSKRAPGSAWASFLAGLGIKPGLVQVPCLPFYLWPPKSTFKQVENAPAVALGAITLVGTTELGNTHQVLEAQ